MTYTAITLARSGSKGLPHKNVQEIKNIALSHFSIIATNNSKSISNLIYSSDSKKYLRLAKEFFEKKNFLNVNLMLHQRSAKNSDDFASSWDAINEIINDFDLSSKGKGIILLSATCPTLKGIDIDYFFDKINPNHSGMTVREVDYPLENTFVKKNGCYAKHCISNFLTYRQNRKVYLRPDGHIYYRPFKEINSKFPNNNTKLIDLKKDFYSNIDTYEDYIFTKYILEKENDQYIRT